MILHTIKKITDLEGNDRLDGRYPLRIGRRGRLLLNGCGCSMAFEYYPRGNENYKGYLQTSTVTDLEAANYITKVTTRNSIYYFEEVLSD
jgi:hypothetical protein